MRCREIEAIIVAQMIVADNGNGFDARRNQEINQNGLYLRLTRFEVIATDESSLFFSQFDDPRYEGILRRSIQIRTLKSILLVSSFKIMSSKRIILCLTPSKAAATAKIVLGLISS